MAKKEQKLYKAQLSARESLYPHLARQGVQHELGTKFKYRYAVSPQQAYSRFRRAFPDRSIVSLEEVEPPHKKEAK